MSGNGILETGAQVVSEGKQPEEAPRFPAAHPLLLPRLCFPGCFAGQVSEEGATGAWLVDGAAQSAGSLPEPFTGGPDIYYHVS